MSAFRLDGRDGLALHSVSNRWLVSALKRSSSATAQSAPPRNPRTRYSRPSLRGDAPNIERSMSFHSSFFVFPLPPDASATLPSSKNPPWWTRRPSLDGLRPCHQRKGAASWSASSLRATTAHGVRVNWLVIGGFKWSMTDEVRHWWWRSSRLWLVPGQQVRAARGGPRSDARHRLAAQVAHAGHPLDAHGYQPGYLLLVRADSEHHGGPVAAARECELDS